MSKISEKAKNFCKIYIENGNATESYITCFTIKDRKQRATSACKLLKKQEVIDYLEQIRAEKQDEIDAEKDKWKNKRESVLNSLYEMTQSALLKSTDRIKASQVFLQNISKYEETTLKTEEENEETLKTQFEVLEKLIEDADLSNFDNIEEK